MLDRRARPRCNRDKLPRLLSEMIAPRAGRKTSSLPGAEVLSETRALDHRAASCLLVEEQSLTGERGNE